MATKNNNRKTAKPAAKAAPASRKVRNAKPVTPESISSAVNARTGNGLVVTTNTGRSIVVSRVDAKVNKLAQLGMPVADLEAYLATQPKPAGRLANGVDAKNSPHSAKAVQDSRKAASSAKGRKGRGDAAAVSGKAAPKAGSMRGLAKAAQKMTILVKPKDSGLAAGSGRMAKLEFAAKCKTTADFLGHTVTDSNGKDHKCDAGALSGMVKRGHVRLG